MSVPSPQILFFVDSYYYNSARVFLESIRDDYEYYAFSDQYISSDIAGFSYTSIDQIGNVSDICFDYVVIASENPDIVYDRIEQGLKAHEYQVMTFLEAADIILPFEGCINFMRLHASTLIPCILPSKEIERRSRNYSKEMHIIMSFNSKFLLPSITTIYTLFKYNDNCHLHIFYQDLSQSERVVIDRLSKLGNNNIIEWHYITDNLEDKIHFEIGRFSIYAIYRFLAYKVLDDVVERALWLDSDLMIRGSIRELYEIDMSDKYYFSSVLEGSDYEDNILGKNREYTNNGVLLMNLKKLRSDDMMDKFWECLFSPDYKYPLSQDALNVVFRYKIKFFKQIIWNSFPITDLSGIPDSEFNMIVNKTKIVHWLSAQKAWLPEYEGYWRSVSEQYPYTKIMYEEYQKRLTQSVDYVSDQ